MHSFTQVKPHPRLDPEYPFAEAPAPGALRTGAPGVYWVRIPPFALEHISLRLLAAGIIRFTAL
jgi:hypothetical protein